MAYENCYAQDSRAPKCFKNRHGRMKKTEGQLMASAKYHASLKYFIFKEQVTTHKFH